METGSTSEMLKTIT